MSLKLNLNEIKSLEKSATNVFSSYLYLCYLTSLKLLLEWCLKIIKIHV